MAMLIASLLLLLLQGTMRVFVAYSAQHRVEDDETYLELSSS